MGASVHYITWAKSVDSADTALLKESTQCLDINLIVLGCNGFLDKIPVLKGFLTSLPSEDIVVCTDGYDALYIKPEEEIVSRFKSFNCPIVFSGEKGCFHHLPMSKVRFESLAPKDLYPYLNSGLMVGCVGAVRSMLDIALSHMQEVRTDFKCATETVGFFNDQTIYGWYLSQNPELATIDSTGRLFWTLSEEKNNITRYAVISRNCVRNIEAHSEPCIVHVSHLKKFYPVYLYIAWKLGIPISQQAINPKLLNSHLRRYQDNEALNLSNVDEEFDNQLMQIDNHYSNKNKDKRKIAIIFIGTGKYIDYFQRYYDSCQALFLRNTSKTFFVFTDNTSHLGLENENVVSIQTQHQRWPLSTLLRFRYINQISHQLQHFSHIVYLDADMYIYSDIEEEDFFSHNKPLFGVRHPGLFSGKRAPFEFDSKSTACVHPNSDLSTYWQGCFWGGEANQLLTMSKHLEQAIDADLRDGVVAKWHDESHLNKYFIDYRRCVHTYDPGYAYPESMEGRLKFQKKIVHIKKHNKSMREFRVLEKMDSDSAVMANEVMNTSANTQNQSYPKFVSHFKIENFEVTKIEKNKSNTVSYKLNKSSAMILKLCNGTNSTSDIILNIGKKYSKSDQENIESDVLETLNLFQTKGLIEIFLKSEKIGN